MLISSIQVHKTTLTRTEDPQEDCAELHSRNRVCLLDHLLGLDQRKKNHRFQCGASNAFITRYYLGINWERHVAVVWRRSGLVMGIAELASLTDSWRQPELAISIAPERSGPKQYVGSQRRCVVGGGVDLSRATVHFWENDAPLAQSAVDWFLDLEMRALDMALKVFICYRRDESAADADRVYDRRERDFGRDLLFMDVDAIPLGANFVKVIGEEVARGVRFQSSQPRSTRAESKSWWEPECARNAVSRWRPTSPTFAVRTPPCSGAAKAAAR